MTPDRWYVLTAGCATILGSAALLLAPLYPLPWTRHKLANPAVTGIGCFACRSGWKFFLTLPTR